MVEEQDHRFDVMLKEMINFNQDAVAFPNSVALPIYLKDLLIYNGFDNLRSLCEFSLADIPHLELFAKEVLAELLEPTESKAFFGIYDKNKTLFRIPEGHRKLLNYVIKICTAYTASKNMSYYINKRHWTESDVNAPKKIRRSFEKQANSPYSIEVKDENFLPETSLKSEPECGGDLDMIRDQIENIAKNYVIRFCNEQLTQTTSRSILDRIDEIRANVTEFTLENNCVGVTCLLCQSEPRAYRKDRLFGITWILSNYNKHFKAHFRNGGGETI